MASEHDGEARAMTPAFARPSLATPGDYFELMKPRVMSLVVFTALTGVSIASTPVNPVLALASLLAIAVGAGASGAFNMAADADIDALMTRTRNRPIPSGRVTRDEAIAFATPLAIGSVAVLGIVANWLAAALLAFTIFFYAVIYTLWLKRWTPQNIVIGGAAGALPPLIGETAMTGHVGIAGVVLFAIIFIWTPPHFWALALVKSDDYAKAGVPMMPNVAGEASTRTQILIYTLILAPFALLPYTLGFGGLAYLIVAALTGAVMIWYAWRVYRDREGSAAVKSAWRLFGFSILYLFLLFATLLAERVTAPVMSLFGYAA
ncbi:heme o synthase [Terrirubrum flagellatum]|uniref:heme o synthase n=1 Tax=Terrirubrum flagellatum TaxID=2895980 RepID=UPI003CC834FD